ncbi:MAG: FKBP-type peptidyl-prolyl cis-trans isomerase [Prevotella sp.]|nr:FKBP-type peptidyl-prolyl cis-trans isomerase [Prevotella sp.]
MGKKQEYKLANEKYLNDLKAKDEVNELPHGILYEIIAKGRGEGKVDARSIVSCNYRGSLISGKVFDDSWQRGYPEAFRVNELITGLQTALHAMHKGDHWHVYIPYKEGYGTKRDGDIPGFSTLIFEIELLDIA